MYEIPSLYLQEMEVFNLRCHDHFQWSCSKGVNLIYGSNGCGKTTLLEGIYMMVFGRSFRQAQLPEMVRWQSSQFQIQGCWQRYGPIHIDMHGKRRKTTTRMQGKTLKNKAGVRNSLDVILDAVQGNQIILATPQERRKWLDHSLLRCHEMRRVAYQAYYRCLLQRNRLQRRDEHSEELHSWHVQLVQHGQTIIQARRTFVQDMNDELQQEQALTERSLTVGITETAPHDGQAWLAQLDQHKRSSGFLRFGPHCDKVNIFFDGQEIRRTASSGQQKLASIALRLVQQRLHGQHRGINPVLILDDCMESLDPIRQQHLLERLLCNQTQIFMSSPEKKEMKGLHLLHLD